MNEILLDWSDPDHWSGRARPCRFCAGTTHLLNDAGLPAHKVCVERLLNNRMRVAS